MAHSWPHVRACAAEETGQYQAQVKSQEYLGHLAVLIFALELRHRGLETENGHTIGSQGANQQATDMAAKKRARHGRVGSAWRRPTQVRRSTSSPSQEHRAPVHLDEVELPARKGRGVPLVVPERPHIAQPAAVCLLGVARLVPGRGVDLCAAVDDRTRGHGGGQRGTDRGGLRVRCSSV